MKSDGQGQSIAQLGMVVAEWRELRDLDRHAAHRAAARVRARLARARQTR
jgi:hypothetical protein